jgi:Ca-activated chloride channel homolog
MFRFAVLFVIFATAGATQQDPQFRTDVALVNVTCSVRSTEGQFVAKLNRDNFEVFEDGVVQKVQFFARQSELPLSIGLIVDASGSQEKFVGRHGRDIRTFLEKVLRPSDRAFALCFGNHLRLASDFTSSPDAILGGLAQSEHGSHKLPELGPVLQRELGTALYDAIYYPIQERMTGVEQRRRALIIFSDGEENSSEHDLLDAIRAAQNADTVLFGIRYTKMEHNRLTARNMYGTRAMDHLAEETGGTTFDGLHTNLRTAFEEIDAQLRTMYELAYASTNPTRDNTYRKLTIRLKEPGLTVRAKSGYFAAKQTADPEEPVR